MPVFERTYKVAAGELKIKITYWSTVNGVLDFGVINIGELEYGYEDEDQLTFFPNVFRIEFTDFERKNYAILKYSLENYPQQKHEDTGRVEVFLNGSLIPVYDGYIDQETLTYDEETRVTSFEAVDFILELKNITTFDINPINPDPLFRKLNDVPTVLWKLFRCIYPELPEPIPPTDVTPALNITNDINVFNSAGYKGIYWEHNWKFKGVKSIPATIPFTNYYADADWKTDYFLPIFGFCYHFWHERYRSETLAEVIKQMSKEFGAIIGSTEKNKIFFKKRYFNKEIVTASLDSKIISGTLNKTLYLKAAQSVKNQNGASAGSLIENPSRPGLPANKYNNLEINTFFVTENYAGHTSMWETNVEINNGSIYRVGKGIKDPDISNETEHTIQELVTHYTYKSRLRSRDKYEMELFGIDYELFNSYRLNMATGGTRILRPMVIKKNLLKNTTSMTALEVGI